MPSDHSPSRPLLPQLRNGDSESHSPLGVFSKPWDHDGTVESYRAQGREVLSSRSKHYAVMAIVALDVAALLGNIFILLISCEMDQREEPWVQGLTDGLTMVGLICSCLFLAELVACFFSFGPSYFSTWFHIFDSAVIVASFAIDLAAQGLAESIGSLVVVLRLWRLAKISEEMVLGSVERVEYLEQHIEELENENQRLRSELGIDLREHSGQD